MTASDAVTVDATEVQSLVLRPRPAARIDIAFVRCASRPALADLLDRAAAALDVAATTDPRSPALNVGLTADAVRLAGVDDRTYRALPPTFREGMRAAAPRLGDVTAACAPEGWEAPFGPDDRPVHIALIAISAAGPPATPSEAAWGPLADDIAGATVWTGRRRPGAEGGADEPFGFRDDVSVPEIEGSGRAVRPGDGVWDAGARRWRAVKAGEAVMGYPDESGTVAGHPDAALVERDGSYLVLRKLHQDVTTFQRECGAWSDATRPGPDGEPTLSPAEVAERIVGRHRDGRALGQAPGAPTNDFVYRDGGAIGAAVPPSSHVRRSNPRDDMENAATLVPRHMLFRRGIPYGVEGSGDEGLLFMTIGADIRRQFEFVQSHWLQDGNRFGFGREQDPLTGVRPAGRTQASIADADGSRLCRGLAPFVATRGGEYLLLPGRTALRHLAATAVG